MVYFFISLKITFYLIDRDFQAPGFQNDMLGEMKRIPQYIRKGDLAPEIPRGVHF